MSIEFHWWPTPEENRDRGAAASKAVGGALVLLAAIFALMLLIGQLFGASSGPRAHMGPWLFVIVLALIAGVGGLFWISGRMAELKTRKTPPSRDHPPAV